MRAQVKAAAIAGLVLQVACGSEIIVHNLEEREANQIIELLAESDINATKGVIDTGRTINYTISVASKSRLDAIKMLNKYEMPRRRDMGYAEVFKDSGLIPTAAEEKAKQLAALEGEIERQLKLVDGILDVQVQIVQPEENALRTVQEVRSPATASVTVRYLPVAGGAKPLSEPQVQAVVAAGVERLTPDNVVVVMTPSGPQRQATQDKGNAEGDRSLVHLDKSGRVLLLGGVVFVLFLCFGLLASQMRLRTVRGRLTRLQAEIAKARRKSTEMPPPNG